jgi:hypothetical protein
LGNLGEEGSKFDSRWLTGFYSFSFCSCTAWKKMASSQQRRFLTVLNIGKIIIFIPDNNKKILCRSYASGPYAKWELHAPGCPFIKIRK